MRQCMTRQRTTGLILSVLGLVTGCVTTQPGPMPLSYAVLRDPTSEPTAPQAAPATAGPLTLVDLLRMSLEANPRLRRSALAVEVAEGKATQAGL